MLQKNESNILFHVFHKQTKQFNFVGHQEDESEVRVHTHLSGGNESGGRCQVLVRLRSSWGTPHCWGQGERVGISERSLVCPLTLSIHTPYSPAAPFSGELPTEMCAVVIKRRV